ncbi:COG4315 family predicted lipoprotein [Propionibacteriaceae bacterium G1746]|uniref:COG4315 family predicted lipoprotein n=1 Tax=Aestuariimicrobium sp. G57 TaxID=3418485 RepID=UPI003C216FC0
MLSSALRTRIAVGVALTALALAGCSGGAGSPYYPTTTTAPATTATTAPSTTAAGTAATTTAATTTAAGTTSAPAAEGAALNLKMADSSLGQILVDGKGMTLYMFTNDTKNTSNCEGPCLTAWPPLIGMPTEGAGVDDSKLGSFTRKDGRVQATYNGWPVYYWMNDKKPGDVSGQNVQGVWFVLDRDGDPVK